MAEFNGNSVLDNSVVDMQIVEHEDSDKSEYLCSVPTQNRFDGVRSERGDTDGSRQRTRTPKRKKVISGSIDNEVTDTETLKHLSQDEKFMCLYDIVTKNNNMLSEMRREQTKYCKATEELQTCVVNLTERTERVECVIEKQSECIKVLAYRSIDIEARSRRNNIILYGISEKPSLSVTDLTLNFFEDELGIDTSEMVIERAHRLGSKGNPNRRTEDLKRPIIIRFRDYMDTDRVMRSAYKLKGTPFGLDRDYPKEISMARKKLYSSQEARDARFGRKKVQIAYPAKLVVDGRVIRDEFPDWHQYLKKDRIECAHSAIESENPRSVQICVQESVSQSESGSCTESDSECESVFSGPTIQPHSIPTQSTSHDRSSAPCKVKSKSVQDNVNKPRRRNTRGRLRTRNRRRRNSIPVSSNSSVGKSSAQHLTASKGENHVDKNRLTDNTSAKNSKVGSQRRDKSPPINSTRL